MLLVCQRIAVLPRAHTEQVMLSDFKTCDRTIVSDDAARVVAMHETVHDGLPGAAGRWPQVGYGRWTRPGRRALPAYRTLPARPARRTCVVRGRHSEGGSEVTGQGRLVGVAEAGR